MKRGLYKLHLNLEHLVSFCAALHSRRDQGSKSFWTMLVLYRMDPVASTSALAPDPIAVDAVAPAVPLTKSAAKRLARRAAFEAAKPASVPPPL